MKKALFLIFLLLSSVSTLVNAETSVSIIQLIASPKTFNGVTVRVLGYASTERVAGISLSSDFTGDYASRVGLALPDGLVDTFIGCVDSYIYVVGRFVFDKEGNRYLDDISKISGDCTKKIMIKGSPRIKGSD